MARGLVVLALVGALASPAFAAPDRIEQARAQTLSDEFQKDLPGTEDAPPDVSLGSGGGDGVRNGSGVGSGTQRPQPQDPRLRRDTRNGQVRDDDPRRDTRHDESEFSAGPMSSVFTFLLWGVIIVGIALLVFWIGAEVLRYGGNDAQLASTAEDDPSRSSIDMAVIQRPLGDAEELAARGEYTEAIHTLLLRTLQELVRSAAVRVSPAMTSREILARVPLLADARDALSGLIIAVEITHFGGDQATLEDYVRCRAQFQVFAAAFQKGGTTA
jgi:hypothetical protein